MAARQGIRHIFRIAHTRDDKEHETFVNTTDPQFEKLLRKAAKELVPGEMQSCSRYEFSELAG
jgi:DNA-binding sugar fermentation-stimulating protein